MKQLGAEFVFTCTVAHIKRVYTLGYCDQHDVAAYMIAREFGWEIKQVSFCTFEITGA
jgi:hypothetical protein